VNAIAATCENDEDVQAWCNEVERWVRWYRVPGYWLAFLVQLATRARKSIWHVLACFRYAEAQVGLADDEALHSLETAYNSLRFNRAAFGDSFEPLNAMLVRTLQIHHDYYSAWLRPFAYRECNPLADHSIRGLRTRRSARRSREFRRRGGNRTICRHRAMRSIRGALLPRGSAPLSGPGVLRQRAVRGGRGTVPPAWKMPFPPAWIPKSATRAGCMAGLCASSAGSPMRFGSLNRPTSTSSPNTAPIGAPLRPGSLATSC